MSPQCRAIQLSHPSVRHAPYSRSYAPASTHRSPVPPGQHSPLDGGGVVNDLSTTDVPRASIDYKDQPTLNPSHPSPAPSFPNLHKPESSDFQSYPLPQESAGITQTLSCPSDRDCPYSGLPQQSAHFAQPPLPERVYPQPTANTFHPDSAVTLPGYQISNSQVLHAARPSITLRRPEDPTYSNFSVGQQDIENPEGPLYQVPPPTRYQNQGMFSGTHDSYFSGNMFINNSTTSENFMEKFLQHTIIGAEYDSSARYPPPRCHPGTRLAIVERCKSFIVKCNGKEKMRWVVGPAGVGKSAIMQMVAEEVPADASVFLSVNGRQDGTKTFTTIAYQLAAKHEPYSQFIRHEISRDHTVLSKALPAQFQKFIVEPFIRRHLFHPSCRFLIIIDGLDECNNPLVQRVLLELISEFCIAYPTSSIVWFIASRPEPHITSFFEDASVTPAYTKEEIAIDSDEACEDVQQYLRAELNRIKGAYPTLRRKREWPSELDFTKIAMAAGGLFAYASTVVRYIGDPQYRDPSARLCHVLETIKGNPSGRDNPMALLDALYKRILSNVPADVMINTRNLLLIYSRYSWPDEKFRFQCNILELSEDAAYAAVSHLHAVMKVPIPAKADGERLEYFHKSFSDFLLDFDRSGFCRNFQEEAEQLRVQSVLRILDEVPGDFNGSHGFCDDISLSWPGDECFLMDDSQLRFDLCSFSIDDICANFGIKKYTSMSIFHLLTTRFIKPPAGFPFDELHSFVFGGLRAELTELGELKQVPLRTLDYAAICRTIRVLFVSPVETGDRYSDPSSQSCRHFHKSFETTDGLRWLTVFERSVDDPGDDIEQTDFPRFNIRAGEDFHYYKPRDNDEDSGPSENVCLYCSRRLAHHFINNADQLATVFVDWTDMCYVESLFVDPDDGVSTWKYQFCHSGRPLCIA